MRFLVLVTLLPCLAARANSIPGKYARYVSPSGKVVAMVGIAGAEASPSVRFRVRLVFETAANQRIGEIWTGFSHSWAVTWSHDDVFLTCGINEEAEQKPMEFDAYDFTTDGKCKWRIPRKSERAKALEKYHRKYPEKTNVTNPPIETTDRTSCQEGLIQH